MRDFEGSLNSTVNRPGSRHDNDADEDEIRGNVDPDDTYRLAVQHINSDMTAIHKNTRRWRDALNRPSSTAVMDPRAVSSHDPPSNPLLVALIDITRRVEQSAIDLANDVAQMECFLREAHKLAARIEEDAVRNKIAKLARQYYYNVTELGNDAAETRRRKPVDVFLAVGIYYKQCDATSKNILNFMLDLLPKDRDVRARQGALREEIKAFRKTVMGRRDEIHHLEALYALSYQSYHDQDRKNQKHQAEMLKKDRQLEAARMTAEKLARALAERLPPDTQASVNREEQVEDVIAGLLQGVNLGDLSGDEDDESGGEDTSDREEGAQEPEQSTGDLLVPTGIRIAQDQHLVRAKVLQSLELGASSYLAEQGKS